MPYAFLDVENRPELHFWYPLHLVSRGAVQCFDNGEKNTCEEAEFWGPENASGAHG